MAQPRGTVLFHAVRWVLRQLGFAYYRLRVAGLERIPQQGGVILAGNHPSVLDGVLMLIISPRPVRFLVTEELYYHRLLHWAFEGMGCIPVFRSRAKNGDALRAAVEALARGEVIGIFPEGTTADAGRMRAVKRGVGLLALKTGCPVVPVGIWGSAEGYPRGARLPRPCQVTVAFGRPVSYVASCEDPVPAMVLERTLEDIRQAILAAMAWAMERHVATLRPWILKRFQVALSALIVLPLCGTLSLTSNPSLESAQSRRSS